MGRELGYTDNYLIKTKGVGVSWLVGGRLNEGSVNQECINLYPSKDGGRQRKKRERIAEVMKKDREAKGQKNRKKERTEMEVGNSLHPGVLVLDWKGLTLRLNAPMQQGMAWRLWGQSQLTGPGLLMHEGGRDALPRVSSAWASGAPGTLSLFPLPALSC